MGSTKVRMPEGRSYPQEMRDTFQAQLDLAPQLYAAESRFRPQYAQLDMDVAKKMLPQMMNLYEGQINPALARMQSQALEAQRRGDVEAIEKYGGRTREAMEAADPETAALKRELNRQAMEELQLGGKLTGGQQRQLRQGVRSGQASRGFGFGISDQAMESLAEMNAMEERRRGRQQFAQGQMAMSKSMSADPYMAILGRPSQVSPMMSGQMMGQAKGFSPGQIFNPESQYAGDIYNQAWQGRLSANTANANNQAAMWGGAMGMLGGLGGGWLGGRGG